MDDQDLKPIFNAIDSGKCLAFLGAGACTAYNKNATEVVPGLPTGAELAAKLATSCDYTNGRTSDLNEVAEYFVLTNAGQRLPLYQALANELVKPHSPRPIHTVLSQLCQIKVIITSNYDTLMEEELGIYGRNKTLNIYDPSNPKTGHYEGPFPEDFGKKDVVLHKMHGSIDKPESMVITESDYISYLTNLDDKDRGMPDYFRTWIIPRYTLLFLGYSLNDWNFRVIWEGVLSKYTTQNRGIKAFALVKDPSVLQINYWATRNVIVFNMDITDFSKEVGKHFKLKIPQLDLDYTNGAEQ